MMTKSTKHNIFKTDGDYVEVKANRSDSYNVLRGRLERKFQKKESCCLLQTNGAKVLNEKLIVRGKRYPWTLGKYLQHLHLSPDMLKLGIGFETTPDTDDSKGGEVL